MFDGGFQHAADDAVDGTIVVHGGHHQAVAQVEVGLPVDGVVFIAPGHVPNGDAGPGGGGVAVAGSTQPVFGVVPFNKEREGLADFFGNQPGNHAHPPTIEFGVDAPVQVAGVRVIGLVAGFTKVGERVGGKVVVVVDVGCGGPHEIAPVDDFAHGVQVAAFLQVKHLATDEHGGFSVAGGGQGAQHGVGLDGDIVIHIKNVGGFGGAGRPVPQGFVHDAGVAARAAKVALAEFVESVAEVGDSVFVARVVSGVLITLIGHDNRVDDGIDFGVLGEGFEGGNGVVRPVEGGNAHGHPRFERTNLGAVGKRLCFGRVGGVPAGLFHGHVGFGGDVPPEPPADFEGGEGKVEFDLTIFHLFALDTDAGAVEFRTVNVDSSSPGDPDFKNNGIELGPASPIAGGEGIEVGKKADLATGSNSDAAAVGPHGALLVVFGFDEVQHAHVVRLTNARQ